jgi:peptidylprolyl isomerase
MRGHRILSGLMVALLALLAGTPVKAASEPLWREIEADRLVFMQLQEGLVVIELNPLFAPKTVQQFRRLVRDGFYDGLSFYRVIDGFVAQGGDGSDLGEYSEVPLIESEFEIEWPEEIDYIQAQSPDLFAPETGFVDGFAVGRDPENNSGWLAHCPGVVAMARNEGPDTSRTDFYIVIGQAPRYLDRNMNVFGRVVHGMDAVQRILRGKPADNGIIEDDMARSRMRSVRLGSDIPDEERPRVLVPDSTDPSFKGFLNGRRDRKEKFFHQRPPRVLDVCQVPMAGRVTR